MGTNKEITEIPVKLSLNILKQLSEELYTSPQKAYEEFISNSWDADASVVHLYFPEDLKDKNSEIFVLDNGVSMDEKGLMNLWTIAASKKEEKSASSRRKNIGKFGIGKLSSYLLANKLIYICKAEDGVIRQVDMDYTRIKTDDDRIELPLTEIKNENLEKHLSSFFQGEKIFEIIKKADGGAGETAENKNEYGGEQRSFEVRGFGTWTIAIMSELREEGEKLQRGVLANMLSASLPLGDDMRIFINGEQAKSSKEKKTKLIINCEIGQNLEKYLENIKDKESTKGFSYETSPYPHIKLSNVGEVTGRVKLFENSIDKGKSKKQGRSHGFFVNICGRVINQDDELFGIEQPNHSVWNSLRVTVRVDGLKDSLVSNREKVKTNDKSEALQSFLKTVVDAMRKYYEKEAHKFSFNYSDALIKAEGPVSVVPLHTVISRELSSNEPSEYLFDGGRIQNREKLLEDWANETSDDITKSFQTVDYKKFTDDDQSLVRFSSQEKKIFINKEHPFVLEYGRGEKAKELLKSVILVQFLSDIYAEDIGVDSFKVSEIRDYRNRLMNIEALKNRESALLIIKKLNECKHQSDESEKMEEIVHSAFRCLGFDVEKKGGGGDTDGIAKAYLTPTGKEKRGEASYSFIYDAKTTKEEKAQTGNLNLDGIVEHKKKNKADYAVVIAPSFQEGTSADRALEQKVTLLNVDCLIKLLQYTFQYGAISLNVFRDEILEYHSSEDVTQQVDSLKEKLQAKRKMTIHDFLDALESFKADKIGNSFGADTLATRINDRNPDKNVLEKNVMDMVKGFAIFSPEIIALEGKDIFITTSIPKLRRVIEESLHDSEIDSDETDS